MDDLEIGHASHGETGAWFIALGGHHVGEMVYETAGPGLITILHTEVGPELRGRGAGLALVKASVAWARQHHTKIVAQCPFARATFEKHPELADVLAAQPG